jgi:hypothetical protein
MGITLILSSSFKKSLKLSEKISMNRERCLICSFHGKSSLEVTPNYLYNATNMQTIHLCYNHSVEFFKIGQTNFLTKYKYGFNEHGLDTNKFFETKSSQNLFSFR